MASKRVVVPFRERCIHQFKDGYNGIQAGHLNDGRSSTDEVPMSVGLKTIGNLTCCKGRSSEHISVMMKKMGGKYIHKSVWEEWVEEWDGIRANQVSVFEKAW